MYRRAQRVRCWLGKQSKYDYNFVRRDPSLPGDLMWFIQSTQPCLPSGFVAGSSTYETVWTVIDKAVSGRRHRPRSARSGFLLGFLVECGVTANAGSGKPKGVFLHLSCS